MWLRTIFKAFRNEKNPKAERLRVARPFLFETGIGPDEDRIEYLSSPFDEMPFPVMFMEVVVPDVLAIVAKRELPDYQRRAVGVLLDLETRMATMYVEEAGALREWIFRLEDKQLRQVVAPYLRAITGSAVVCAERMTRSDIRRQERETGSSFKDVVHIRKTAFAGSRGLYGGELDYSHRFEVRGHWKHFWLDKERRIVDESRIGKDQFGSYCVAGKTWRNAHVRGPEDKPLLRKTRVVEGKSNIIGYKTESSLREEDFGADELGQSVKRLHRAIKEGHMAKEEIAYCTKCRKKVAMADVEKVTMKNGRPAAKGKCSVCDTNVYKILATKRD